MIINLLSSENYCIYNKTIGKKLGPIAAIILSILCGKYDYFRKQNQLATIAMDFDGVEKEVDCFYSTRPQMKEETGISPDQQRAAEKKLIDVGIIKVKDCGMPKRNYYYLDEQAIADLLKKEM